MYLRNNYLNISIYAFAVAMSIVINKLETSQTFIVIRTFTFNEYQCFFPLKLKFCHVRMSMSYKYNFIVHNVNSCILQCREINLGHLQTNLESSKDVLNPR